MIASRVEMNFRGQLAQGCATTWVPEREIEMLVRSRTPVATWSLMQNVRIKEKEHKIKTF